MEVRRRGCPESCRGLLATRNLVFHKGIDRLVMGSDAALEVEFAGAFESDGKVGVVEEELAGFGPTEFRFCDEFFDVFSLVVKDALVKRVAFDIGA